MKFWNPYLFIHRAAATLSLLFVVFAASTAQAEGFLCQSVDQDLRIHVENEKADWDGSSRSGKMIITDPTVNERNRHVATFLAKDGLLNNSGAVVVAYVDLSNPNSSRGGERIGGTTLGQISSIVLDIDFSFSEPVKEGARLSAQVVYIKLNGKELVQDFDCLHYLSDTPNWSFFETLF